MEKKDLIALITNFIVVFIASFFAISLAMSLHCPFKRMMYPYPYHKFYKERRMPPPDFDRDYDDRFERKFEKRRNSNRPDERRFERGERPQLPTDKED